jgi:F-type H+-transporting ATPase subunit b
MPTDHMNRQIGRGFAIGLVAVSAAFLLVDPALAADEAAHGGGGLPQLNPVRFASQIFWTLASFGLLFWLMSKVALPRVAEVLEARQLRITQDLERAQALKSETDAVIATYERALAEARASARKVLSTATIESEAEATGRQRTLADTLAQRNREAETRIRGAQQAAVQNIRTVAAEAAVDAADRLAGVSVSLETAEQAVETVLKERN